MEQNKTSKYFKYAIGEIVLVVIGILIALQINTWNQNKNEIRKETLILKNLKNDLNADIKRLTKEDSTYAIRESKSARAIHLFYKASTVKEIDSIGSLIDDMWNVLYINNNTYLEMINSGSMYSMKNKDLQEKIIAHYLNVNADKNYINDVNTEQAILYNQSPDIYPYKFLAKQLKKPKIDLNLIDTTWIANPNSSTYLAVEHYLSTQQEYSNTYRRSVYKRNITRTQRLLSEINSELENRK